MTSGRSLTEEERAAHGWGRMTLRLPSKILLLLECLAEERGQTRAEFITELIEDASAEYQRNYRGP